MPTYQYVRYPTLGGGGGSGNITDINGQVGPSLSIVAGSGISVVTTPNTITISSTGGSGTVTSVTASSPLFSSGGVNPNLTIQVANSTQNGYLSSTDWNTFNNKQAALTFGNLTDVGTDGITITGGTGSVIGSGTSISQQVADSTHNGYLSSTDWTTFNNKLDPSSIVMNPNTFAGFDNSGNLESIPGWDISTITGGVSELITLTPADSVGGQTDVINNFQNTVAPVVDLANLSHYNMQNYLYLLSPFNMVDTTGLRNGVETQDIGNKGNITVLSQSLYLGDGTNVSSSENSNTINSVINVNNNHTVNQNISDYNSTINVQSGGVVTNGITGLNSSINVNTGGTANYINSLQMFMNIDGQVNGSASLGNLGVNVNVSQPAGVGLNGFGLNSQVYGLLQYSNGYNHNLQLRTGADITNGVQGFNDSTHQETGTTTHGVVSFSAYPNFDTGSIVAGGYSGVNISPNISGDMTGAGYNGVNISGQMSGPMQYFGAYNNFANFNTGSSVVNSIQGYANNPNVQTGVTIQGSTDFGAYTNLHAGSTADYVQGFNAGIQIDGTINNNVTLMNLNVNGASTVPNLQGINVNLSGLNSTTQKQGLQINDGNIQVQANYYTDILPASPGFLNLNGIGGTLWVKPGNPVTNTLSLLNNIGVTTIFEDDYGPDPFIGTLGVANTALVGQIAVANGKTVSAFNELLIVASIPPAPSPIVDGGTITDMNMIRMFGLLSQGGTLSVNNFYQIKMESGGSSLATNAWGLYIDDSNLQNYFKSSIAIDTSTTKVSNSSVGLEIGSTTKALRLSNLTTTERNALTPLAGMEIFNTSTGQVEFYNGTSWTSGGGGGGSTENVEYHTITSGEETAKQFTLANTPTIAANVLVDIITGGPQAYSLDFTITGNVFDWNGLGLDGILSAGDIVRLHYLS